MNYILAVQDHVHASFISVHFILMQEIQTAMSVMASCASWYGIMGEFVHAKYATVLNWTELNWTKLNRTERSGAKSLNHTCQKQNVFLIFLNEKEKENVQRVVCFLICNVVYSVLHVGHGPFNKKNDCTKREKQITRNEGLTKRKF